VQDAMYSLQTTAYKNGRNSGKQLN